MNGQSKTKLGSYLGWRGGNLKKGEGTLVRSQLAPIEVNNKFLQKVRNKSFLKDTNRLPLCSENLGNRIRGGKKNKLIYFS